MRIQTLMLAAVAALTLGAAACTPAEQQEAEANAEVAGEKAGDAAAKAGEVIESGAMKAARAVEEGAGNVATRLEQNQAKAAAEGRPGAVDPATDERVPAN
jgi:type IV secretory pathway TrbL component